MVSNQSIEKRESKIKNLNKSSNAKYRKRNKKVYQFKKKLKKCWNQLVIIKTVKRYPKIKK